MSRFSSDSLYGQIQKAENCFRAHLKKALQDYSHIKKNYPKHFLVRDFPEGVLGKVIYDCENYFSSRGMAVEYAVGGAGMSAPKLFEMRFTQEHFTNTQQRQELIDNVEHLINQFNHGASISAAAGTLLYARFYEIAGNKTKKLMTKYLQEARNVGADSYEAVLERMFPENAGLEKLEKFLIRNETTSFFETGEGQRQHARWLRNILDALESGDLDEFVGKKIGVVAGALQENIPAGRSPAAHSVRTTRPLCREAKL